MEFMERKFGELAEINALHVRRQIKETARMRQRVLEVLKSNGFQASASDPVCDNETEEIVSEAVVFGGEDLILLKAIEGPSAFGRLLGSKIFGSEDKCYLMCLRLGPKILRRSGRLPCDSERQNIFFS